MGRVVTARAPARLDLGGGWTDVPPYCDEQGGVVCNLAITRRATVRLSDEPARDVAPHLARAALRHLSGAGRVPTRIELASDFPQGAGLGGSSAAGVAMVAALARWRGLARTREALAEESRAIEVDELGIAGGRQDHYAAAFGGALELRFAAGPAVVRAIPLPDETRAALERRCIVAYTGESRISGRTITAVLDAWRAGAPHVCAALGRMRDLAEAMAIALRQGDVDRLGALVGEHWRHQRTLDPAIPTPLIDRVIRAAEDAGALGCKALGASGGGCVLAIAADGHEDDVRRAMGAKAEVLSFAIDVEGVVVEETT